MVKNKAKKGARFENELLNIGLENGIELGMRGASSKSRSGDKDLKIDLMLIKGNTLFIIQAKNWKRPASKPSIERFYASTLALSLKTLKVKPIFIEDKGKLEKILKEEEKTKGF